MLIKKTLVFLLVLCGISTSRLLAQNVKDVFSPDVKVTWCGVDYSVAKFVGVAEEMKLAAVEKEVPNWNALFDKEREKYNVEKHTGKNKVEYALNIAQEHNDGIDFTNAVTNKIGEMEPITKADVQKVVGSYDFKSESGLGMLMVVESFNKYKVEGIVWVTFFDIASKNVIVAERLVTKPGGFGFKNYWARSILETFEAMESNWYLWKKKYAAKK